MYVSKTLNARALKQTKLFALKIKYLYETTLYDISMSKTKKKKKQNEKNVFVN